MKPETSEWMKIAEEEVASADLLLEHRLHRMVCLHSQQAVEKTLKALLTERGMEFKKTHNIVDLLALLKTQDLAVTLNHEEAGFLNAIYRSRYPPEAGLLPHGEPSGEDAAKALTLAERVVADGKRLLGGRK
jgi:HEPN domain-containing protein